MLLEIGDNLLVRILRTRGVHIHAGNARLWEDGRQRILNLLCTKSFHLNIRTMTSGALVRHLDGIAAIMAFQQVGFLMVGQRHVAILALGHRLASVANHSNRIAAPVLEQDNLFLTLQRHGHLLDQKVGKKAFHLMTFGRQIHINRVNIRQFTFGVSLHQFHQSELMPLHIVVAFQRRRGRPQQRLRPMNLRQHHRGVSGVVARCRIHLLVGTVVLFIHNH